MANKAWKAARKKRRKEHGWGKKGKARAATAKAKELALKGDYLGAVKDMHDAITAYQFTYRE